MSLATTDAVALPDIDKLPASALLTRAQVAALSGFAEVTLRLWTRQGRGPRTTTIEGRPRYRAADVAAWLAAS